MYARAYACLYACVCVCMSVCLFVCLSVCLYVCMYVYVSVHIILYIYIHNVWAATTQQVTTSLGPLRESFRSPSGRLVEKLTRLGFVRQP